MSFEKLFNDMLDDYVEMWGVINAICWLIDEGCTNDFIEDLGFNRDDILHARAM